MAKTHLKNTELDVHRILDGPVRINGAYGPMVVPQGHFVIQFPGEFELATALPPDAFIAMFDPSDDERSEWGLPKADDEEQNPIGDVNPPTKMTPTSTGPDAVIGVGGDYPPDRPDTLPQSPQAGSSVGPASTTPEGVYPPTDAAIRGWVAAHYKEAKTQVDKITERLMGNRGRAAVLLERYPVASADANEPPAAEAVAAPGELVDPNAEKAPDQAETETPDPVILAGTTPTDQIVGATEQPTPPEAEGAPADETGEGSFDTPTAVPGIDLSPAAEPPVAPNQSSQMEPSPGRDDMGADTSAKPNQDSASDAKTDTPGTEGTPPS